MSTSYQILSDKFTKRLVNDKNFMNYSSDLSQSEIETLVEDHIKDLIDQSVGMIYKYGTPDVNFYDKDDTAETFNFDFVNQEVSLFIEVMYYCYMSEDRNKLHILGLTFRSSELAVFSPAADRDSYIAMLKGIEINVINSISDYLARDRLTWQYKSIYTSTTS